FILGYAAPQSEWRALHPSDCAFWHTIAWAADNGFRYFDMGADSPQQIGLLRFKKKWGGVHYPMFYYYSLNGASALPNFDSSPGTYAQLRRVWSQLPVPMSKQLGSWLTRQLS